MKFSPRWRGWLPKNAQLRSRLPQLAAMEDMGAAIADTAVSHRDCASSRSISSDVCKAIPSNYCGPLALGGPADYPRVIRLFLGFYPITQSSSAPIVRF